uniref:Putative secreted protein n=1 Tax=Anopheles darlingi TaxID=43151 RepID=A0A2M4D6Q9_ANODA
MIWNSNFSTFLVSCCCHCQQQPSNGFIWGDLLTLLLSVVWCVWPVSELDLSPPPPPWAMNKCMCVCVCLCFVRT